MRKGVVDIRRRVDVCRGTNARYLDALAVVGDSTPSHRVLDPVSQPVITGKRRFRALQPISPADSQLFQQVLAGENLLQGVRNAMCVEFFIHTRNPIPANAGALQPGSVAVFNCFPLMGSSTEFQRRITIEQRKRATS